MDLPPSGWHADPPPRPRERIRDGSEWTDQEMARAGVPTGAALRALLFAVAVLLPLLLTVGLRPQAVVEGVGAAEQVRHVSCDRLTGLRDLVPECTGPTLASG